MSKLQPMVNETVFSWVTRYHIKVGIGVEKNTYQALFKQDKVRLHAFLPSALGRLESKGERSSEEWLYQHTLYPLFRFFEHDKEGKLLNAMLADSGYSVSHAHIPHSRLNFPYGHKICPMCALESKRKRGFAYYDIRFQIPGIEVCPLHVCYLQVTSCGDYGLDQHLYLAKVIAPVRCNDQQLLQFTQFCFDTLAISRTITNSEELQILYRKELFKKGFITQYHHIRMHLLVNDISNFYQCFSFENGWENISDFKFIGPLLRHKTHTPCHPAKHLLFAFWLFDGDANKFKIHQTVQPIKVEVKNAEGGCSEDHRIIELLQQGVSMEKISHHTEKSRCYIKRRCELAGIQHQTTKSAFQSQVKHKVLIQALLGRHRQVIADNLEVGIGYVEQAISNTKGLTQWRKKLHVLRRISASSKELLYAKTLHPNWYRKDYKSNHNKAFFYLYHHARELLEAILPEKLPPRRPIRDWSSEDERLCKAILNLEQINDMSLTEIGLMINDRSHLRKKLGNLPKTKALLQRIGKLPFDNNEPT